MRLSEAQKPAIVIGLVLLGTLVTIITAIGNVSEEEIVRGIAEGRDVPKVREIGYGQLGYRSRVL